MLAASLEQAFAFYDTKGRGRLGADELAAALSNKAGGSLAFPPEEARAWAAKLIARFGQDGELVIAKFVDWHRGQAPIGSLDAYRSARVRELFKLADFTGSGSVELRALATADAPPRLQERVALMRADGLGFVSAAAWEDAFAAEPETSLSAMGAPEFDATIDEAAVFLEMWATIQEALSMAGATGVGDSSPVGPVDVPQLPPDRAQQVAQLFEHLDPMGSGKIGIETLSQRSVRLGPHAATPFDMIVQMDADGDGDVTREEMFEFFRYISAPLNDGDFAVIIQICSQLGEV